MTNDEMIFSLLKQKLLRVDLKTGEVFSNRRNTGALGTHNKKGYLVSTLRLNGIRRQIKLHRVVLTAKMGFQLPVGSLVDHENRIKDDNSAGNLRIAGALLNSLNRRSYKGEDNPAAKNNLATAEQVRNHHKMSKSYRKTAQLFSISTSLVAQIVRKELWS